MERYCRNKTNKCSSKAEIDDDDSYVEMDELGKGQGSSQSTGGRHSTPILHEETGQRITDDDNDYVNTEEFSCHPMSKQSTESGDDDSDGDYVNTVDQTFKQSADDEGDHHDGIEDYEELDDHPVPEQSTVSPDFHNNVNQCKPASSNRGLKIVLVILVFLLLGALAALSSLLVLYLDNVTAFDTIREQHANLTANMIMQQQDSVRMKIYTDLKKKYQRAHEVLSKSNVSGLCKEDWKPLGLKCYFFSNQMLNWVGSRDFCVEKNADLVTITSTTEENFVSSNANGTFWIGLKYLETEGKWMWLNKQTLEETKVTFWNEVPKNPSGETCVSVRDQSGRGTKWFAHSCQATKRYICEM